MPAFLRKYNTAATLDGVVLITRGAADYKANPTLAAGDVQISKDGGAFANLATLPTVTPAAETSVKVVLSAAELQCARAVIRFIDQTATKEWEDQEVIVETFGNSSGAFGIDLSAERTPVNLKEIDGNTYPVAYVLKDVLGAIQTAAVVADGGNTASTFKTDSAKVTDDFFKNHVLVFSGGVSGNLGNFRVVSAYNGTTKFITLEKALPAVPSAADRFYILPLSLLDSDLLAQALAALNTAVPGFPVADSINERVKTLDDNYTTARAAKIDNLDVAVSTRASAADQTAIKAKTDLLTFDGDNAVKADANKISASAAAADAVEANIGNLDAAISSRSTPAQVAAAEANIRGADADDLKDISDEIAALPTAAGTADAVWDELRAGHVAGGSFGEGVKAESLNAQAKADVNAEADAALDTAIPGVPTPDSVNERVKTLDENYTAVRAAKLDNLDQTLTALRTYLVGASDRDLTEVYDLVNALNNLTPAQVENAVWNAARASHIAGGSFGEGVKVEDLNAAAKASVNAEVVDVEAADLLPELATVPAATPTLRAAMMLVFMALRNQLTTDKSPGQMKIRNDAGTVISKANLTDDGTTFTRDKLQAGP